MVQRSFVYSILVRRYIERLAAEKSILILLIVKTFYIMTVKVKELLLQFERLRTIHKRNSAPISTTVKRLTEKCIY